MRLNALINIDPVYDPNKPGRRTMGDHIPWNEEIVPAIINGNRKALKGAFPAVRCS